MSTIEDEIRWWNRQHRVLMLVALDERIVLQHVDDLPVCEIKAMAAQAHECGMVRVNSVGLAARFLEVSYQLQLISDEMLGYGP